MKAILLTVSRFIHQLLALAALTAIPVFVYWRADLVDARIGRKFGLPGKFDLAVIHTDALLLAGVFALLLLSWRQVRRGWHFLPGIVVSLLLLIYLADLVILEQFGTRILLSSVQLYIQYTAQVWEQAQEFLGGFWPAIGSVSAFLVFALVLMYPPAPTWPVTRTLCTVFLISSIAAALMPWKIDYVNSWIVESYLSANIFVPEARIYTDDIAREYLSSSNEPLVCEAGLAQRKNVIILIVESLSSYQSKLFEGHRDWLPELSELATEAAVFPGMHSNGFSTNEGLIGILGGVRFFSPFAHKFRAVVSFQTAWGLEKTLPSEFNKAGYQTAFLTTGPLSFSSMDKWLLDIGFAEIEGNEHPFYKDWDKVQFAAASDEALYARSLEWIAGQPANRPWLLTLATMSTHQPFRHPETQKPDIEQVFRYADKQAAEFIRTLQNSGYFDSGILLVLGDHRSMTPISRAEEDRFGSVAASRIPLILFGTDYTGLHPGVFHQSDLLPSFKHWLGNETCHEGQLTSIFAADSPGRCALHLRGAKQSLVEVVCPEGHGQVKLDGDHTKFIDSDGISTHKQASILRTIARQRLAGEQRHQEHLATLENRE